MSIEPKPRIYYSQRLKQKFISSLRPLDDVQPFTKQKEGDLINFRHTIVEGNIRRGRNGGVVVQKSSKLSTIILSKSTAKKKKIKHARCRSDGCDINLRISIPKNNMKTSPSYAKIFKPLNLFGINNNNKERYLSKKKSQKEKGGRVDLINHKCSQSTLSLSNTDRYSIRKSSPDSTFTFSRYRVPLVKKEQSAKIIQSWWRFLNIKLKPMRDMIIKIQSVWRGFYLRKYVFDVIYLTLFCQNFCDKINDVLRRIARRENFPKLFGKAYTKIDKLKLVIKHNEYNRPNRNKDVLQRMFRKFVWRTIYKQSNKKSALMLLSRLTFLLEECIKRKEKSIKDFFYLSLLKYFYRWSLINKSKKHIMLKSKHKEHSVKRLCLSYHKCNMIFPLMKRFLMWRRKVQKQKERNKKGFSALNKIFLKRIIMYWNDLEKLLTFTKKMKKKIRADDKKEMYNKFYKWRSIVHKIKYRTVNLYLCKNIKKGKTVIKHTKELYHYFFIWKNCSFVFFKQDKKTIKQKINNLIKAIASIPRHIVFTTIKKKFVNPKHLMRIVNQIENNKKLVLYPYFIKWKEFAHCITFNRKNCYALFRKYYYSDDIQDRLIHNQIDELIGYLNNIDTIKHKKGKTISQYIKGILNIKHNCIVLKRNIITNKLLLKKIRKAIKKEYTYFYLWVNKCKHCSTQNNAKIVQNFIRAKIASLNHRKNGYQKISKKLLQSYKKECFSLIRDIFFELPSKSYKEKRLQKLKHVVITLLKKNERVMRNKFYKMKTKTSAIKHEDKVTQIQSYYRKKKSIIKFHQLSKIYNNLIRRILFNDSYSLKYLRVYLSKWIRLSKNEHIKNNISIIQNFLRKKYQAYRCNKVKNFIVKCAYKKLTNFFDTLAHCPDIVKTNKATELCKVLTKLYIKKPRYKLINAMKWLMRIKALKILFREISETLNGYYYPIYFSRWKERTSKDTFTKIVNIQKNYKKYLKYKSNSNNINIDKFLRKYLHKLQNDKEMLQIISLRNWKRKSYTLRIIYQLIKIQKQVRLYIKNK